MVLVNVFDVTWTHIVSQAWNRKTFYQGSVFIEVFFGIETVVNESI